jgi:hypothetical protein
VLRRTENPRVGGSIPPLATIVEPTLADPEQKVKAVPANFHASKLPWSTTVTSISHEYPIP